MFDYDNPPKTVVGARDPETAASVLGLYAALPGPKISIEIEVAEMVKYADNAWHAVKASFANEIGNIAKAIGVDSWKVMDIFCQDKKRNISPYYLKLGFAFGGTHDTEEADRAVRDQEGRASAGEASFYARPDDPIDFAEKIAWLLDRPEERERMGEIGRTRVIEGFSWDHSAPRLLAAYDRAFAKMGRA